MHLIWHDCIDSSIHNKDHSLLSKKIQLWSNYSRSEYAIRLEGVSDILTATSEEIATAQYTELVEEVDHLADLKYDWTYTLKHWISNRDHHNNTTNVHDSEKTIPSYSSTTVASTSSSVYEEKTNTDNKFDYEKLKNDHKARYESNNMSKHVGYNRILPFKCHSCKLVFGSKAQRRKHEQAWHSNSDNTKSKRTTMQEG